MASEHLIVEDREGVRTIKLNRPEVLNSFNRRMSAELLEALQGAADSREIRALLLTGEGRAFCAGQDLAEVAPSRDGTLPELGEIVRSCYNPVISALRDLPKPVVCAVNGIAAGAGANLALACDLVLASHGATFIQAFSKIGLIPDSGGTFFLPRLVGLGRATALAMLAERLPAEEALRLGLIYKLFVPQELLPEATKLAMYLAQQPTRGFAALKKALNQSFSNSLKEQLELEAQLQGECGRSADYKEGVSAFLGKRSPQFKGE
ncbi:MAG: 2-(1,2-epoxy-1,2-dihydrophenyl)acetyl-CoA isomerase PaaG [Oligoflexia bacterium]|nr:2-(1,2-epoxy-1,2-dihydrophenyl)acetyl-CoA isomerase PaaG [Oligoflexia bacterium]